MHGQANHCQRSDDTRHKGFVRRGLFTYGTFFVGVTLGVLIGSAMWLPTDVTAFEKLMNRHSAIALRPIEQRLGLVEQRTKDLLSASQDLAADGNARLGELTKALREIETLAANLPRSDLLEEQAMALSNLTARAETVLQQLAVFDQQSAARARDLQMSPVRTPEPVRTAPVVRNTGTVDGRGDPQSTASGELSSFAASTTGKPPVVAIEPATGLATRASGFWSRLPNTRMQNTGTEGAEIGR